VNGCLLASAPAELADIRGRNIDGFVEPRRRDLRIRDFFRSALIPFATLALNRP
jgi:hypothetical protein